MKMEKKKSDKVRNARRSKKKRKKKNANRLQKVLPSIIHPMQYGFIAGRDILHNILNVQMAVDYAKTPSKKLL
jgi:hypothetical protein